MKLPAEFQLMANAADELQKAVRHQGLGPVRCQVHVSETRWSRLRRLSEIRETASGRMMMK